VSPKFTLISCVGKGKKETAKNTDQTLEQAEYKLLLNKLIFK